MPKHVALLRGINVGGKNKLPMRELAAMFTAAGCTDVTTYIQSGNVVFSASPAVAKTVAAFVVKRIEKDHGLRVPVLLRSAVELERVMRENPFLAAGAAPDKLHVMFLADAPKRAAVSALDANRSPPDAFEVVGREVYLHCPEGFGRTKLTNAYFDAKLATTSTVRNWRTVLTLGEMVRVRST